MGMVSFSSSSSSSSSRQPSRRATFLATTTTTVATIATVLLLLLVLAIVTPTHASTHASNELVLVPDTPAAGTPSAVTSAAATSTATTSATTTSPSGALDEVEVEVEIAASPSPPPAAEPTSPPLPEFIATDEWQVVQPGQAIPPGLWVRMDITTGVKTARLMPPEEMNEGGRKLAAQRAAAAAAAAAAKAKAHAAHAAHAAQEEEAAAVVVVQQTQVSETQLTIVPSEEEPAVATVGTTTEKSNIDAATPPTTTPFVDVVDGPSMRELPEPGSDVSSEELASPQSESALLAARAERLRLLKEHFYLKEDVEQMKQLLAICIDASSTVDDVLRALGNLEDYLHQIDNARDWATIGGMDVAVMFLQQRASELADGVTIDAATLHRQLQQENETTTAGVATDLPAPLSLQVLRLYELQAGAAWVLGTAAQNNPHVQKVALQQGAIEALTQLLGHTMAQEDALRSFGSSMAETSMTETPLANSADSVPVEQQRVARLKLQAKVLYALSSLLRNNAGNQRAFHEANGAELLLTDPVAFELTGPGASDPKLQKLHANVHLKRVSLLHDLLADELINSTGEAQSIAERSLSDSALFSRLTRDDFCQHYFGLAATSFGPTNVDANTPPSTPQLRTLEQSLAIVDVLLTEEARRLAAESLEATQPAGALAFGTPVPVCEKVLEPVAKRRAAERLAPLQQRLEHVLATEGEEADPFVAELVATLVRIRAALLQ